MRAKKMNGHFAVKDGDKLYLVLEDSLKNPRELSGAYVVEHNKKRIVFLEVHEYRKLIVAVRRCDAKY